MYIAGVGMTPFGKHLDTSVKQLTRAAVNDALADAGCDSRQLQGAFFGNSTQGHMEGQHMIRGQLALRAMGIDRIPVINVENACASASTAFHLAVNYVRAHAADIVLAVGAEKMFSPDKARTFSAFDGAWDVHDTENGKRRLLEMGHGIEPPEGSVSTKPYSVFMDIYASMGRMHMREFGTTQRQFAAVSAKNHGHSVHNPLAQYQQAYYDRRDPRRAADHLSAHAADVLACQRRGGGGHRMQRGRARNAQGTTLAGHSRSRIRASDRNRPAGHRARPASGPAGFIERL